MLQAALATGVAAHVDDFDDTHLATVIHPAAASLAAALPVAAGEGLDGGAALRAFALGCEIQLRLGNAVSPSHYDLGWHITGTCGAVGAAVTAGVLYGLDAAGLESAVGLATLTTLGHRQAFGSMTKAFHPGKARPTAYSPPCSPCRASAVLRRPWTVRAASWTCSPTRHGPSCWWTGSAAHGN